MAGKIIFLLPAISVHAKALVGKKKTPPHEARGVQGIKTLSI
jgi:hypothetical protein